MIFALHLTDRFVYHLCALNHFKLRSHLWAHPWPGRVPIPIRIRMTTAIAALIKRNLARCPHIYALDLAIYQAGNNDRPFIGEAIVALATDISIDKDATNRDV